MALNKNTGTAKIELKDVSFSYEAQPVLSDVSFTIQKGEVVTIIGPNGGGKTTLLRLILGLIAPQKGIVLINGILPRKAQNLIGYVPQYLSFDTRFPITVLEVVLLGTLSKSVGFYSKKDKKEALKALEQSGLSHLKDESFFHLSGGQRQRVLIARALAGEPDILLLDEPTANVDTLYGDNLNILLQSLNKHMTILLATHDLGFVSNITKRVLCVNREVFEHPVEELANGLIASSYGHQSRVVRHDLNLNEKICRGGA
jgi:zinc transport system ATP-binding protein